MLPCEDEHLALMRLFCKETKLLQTIDRLRVSANKEIQKEKTLSGLIRISEPKEWNLSNGNNLSVHTPFTTRAKQLGQLYAATLAAVSNLEERLDILLHVKWTIKEYDCDLTRQLVDLIDREADMLKRCADYKHQLSTEGSKISRVQTMLL